MGFCFWEWQVISINFAGVGASLFFIILQAICFVYLHVKGIRQNTKSLLMLGVAFVGALPFVLNGAREINIILLVFEACACLLWVMYSCRTVIAPRLSGFLILDLVNQICVVPFVNFGRVFGCIIQKLSSRKQNGKRTWLAILLAVAGLAVALPVILLVLFLLASSDIGFRSMLQDILEWINLERIFSYSVEFLFGIPVACYIFGAIYGNVHKRYSGLLSYEPFDSAFKKAHVLPRVALYAPLVCFIVIYVLYFIAMASYHFSALGGELPDSFTYAQYARQGFFELCAVASINLCILGVAYLLARREAGALPKPGAQPKAGIQSNTGAPLKPGTQSEPGAQSEAGAQPKPGTLPKLLRLFTGILSLLTCLLIITAASKMYLYIETYGLSPLRIYTSWFIVFLLIIFLILLVWHIKPFNAAGPVVVVALLMTLALGLTNTDGIIARYNTDRYLSGQTELIDVELLGRLSDSALPSLYELRDKAPDAEVRKEAQEAIKQYDWNRGGMLSSGHERYDWFNWNLQFAQAQGITKSA